MRISLLAAVVLSAATLAAAQNTPWDYQGKRGALAWGKLDPAYRACSQGREQSPIDIHGAHLNKALAPIEFHYISGPVTLENTGHTIVVHVDPGSYIIAGGVRYELEQFHFHHPSEETVKGKFADMGVHLVHKSANGKIAVIAVRMNIEVGEANATLATLWQHLPTTVGAKERITDMVNPGGLLPGDRGYWTYLGSLTAPPCTEGVRWFIFENPMSISKEQFRAFSGIIQMNARPLQDAHGRRIEANE